VFLCGTGSKWYIHREYWALAQHPANWGSFEHSSSLHSLGGIITSMQLYQQSQAQLKLYISSPELQMIHLSHSFTLGTDSLTT
jgi:hypothetical protein